MQPEPNGQTPGQQPAEPQSQQAEGATGTQPANNQEPKYITEEKLQEALKAVKAETYQQTQSLVDKSRNQVTAKMQDFEKGLAAINAVKPLSPEEQKAMRADALQKFQQEALLTPDPGATTGQQPGGDEPPLDPSSLMALEYEQRMGVKLEAGDKEIATVKVDGTPTEYLDSYKAALDAKKQRMQANQQGDANNQNGNGSDSGAIPTGANGGVGAGYDPAQPPSFYFEQHEQEKRRR